jgi:hypothetical protein
MQAVIAMAAGASILIRFNKSIVFSYYFEPTNLSTFAHILSIFQIFFTLIVAFIVCFQKFMYFCVIKFASGVLSLCLAEMIPFEPMAGNAVRGENKYLYPYLLGATQF